MHSVLRKQFNSTLFFVYAHRRREEQIGHIISSLKTSFLATSCHEIACRIKSHHGNHVPSYQVIPCHIMYIISVCFCSDHVSSWVFISYSVISDAVFPCPIMTCHVMSCHTMPYLGISCQNKTCRIRLFYVMRHHTLSCHNMVLTCQTTSCLIMS